MKCFQIIIYEFVYVSGCVTGVLQEFVLFEESPLGDWNIKVTTNKLVSSASFEVRIHFFILLLSYLIQNVFYCCWHLSYLNLL